jgi:hypothetical protein
MDDPRFKELINTHDSQRTERAAELAEVRDAMQQVSGEMLTRAETLRASTMPLAGDVATILEQLVIIRRYLLARAESAAAQQDETVQGLREILESL